MWSTWFGKQKRAEQLQHQAPAGPLRTFYQHAAPANSTPLQQCDFVALDFETTGLDLEADDVISFGLVAIHEMGIQLGSAVHQLVKTSQAMPQESAVIHCITDDIVSQGLPLEEAMCLLLPALQGKVLIAHHADIELGFLNKISQALYNTPFVMPTIDTQQLAMRQLQREQRTIKPKDLRLFNLQQHYGLPVYKAHHALNDALSTAELFLALISQLCPKLNCRLKDYLVK